MKAKFFLYISTFLFSLRLNAQTQSNGFYSVYGLGVPVSTHLGLVEAMGGSGVALRPNLNINTKNPASLNSIEGPFTFFLNTGFDVSATFSENDNTKGQSYSGGLTHFDMWFRINNKWASSIGITPVTEVKYRIFSNRYYEPDGSSYDIFNEGSGGLNQFRLMQSFSPFKNINLGAVASVYFGSISASENIIGIESAPRIEVETQSALSGFNYELGFQYNLALGLAKLNLGATYRPEKIFDSVQDYTLTAIGGSLEGELEEEEVFALPEQWNAGLALQNKRLNLALDMGFEQWSNLNHLGNTQIEYAYQDVLSFSLGGEYGIPKRGYESPFSDTYLRAGIGARNSYLQIDDSDFLIWNFSLGIGLPVSQFRNQLNLTYQFNQQGRINSDLVRESTHSLSFSFTLRDVWFQKRKYN